MMNHERLKHCIQKLLEYNWADEFRDYREQEEGREVHIFHTLVELANFIDGTEYAPTDHLRFEDERRANIGVIRNGERS